MAKKTPRTSGSVAMDDYLEQILHLIEDKGLTIANAIVMRHEMLTKFLRLFGLNEDTIYKDVEGMEHHVSKDTLNVITSLVAELEENPDLLERVKKRI